MNELQSAASVSIAFEAILLFGLTFSYGGPKATPPWGEFQSPSRRFFYLDTQFGMKPSPPPVSIAFEAILLFGR